MWFFSLILPLAFADVGRLTTGNSDLSQVEKIYLSPGLVSLVEFPQNIIEVRVGNPKSVKALISQVSPKELTIYLTGGVSAPSNLIVRAEKRVFVFDIVPSRVNHQDYVKIRSTFGSPETRNVALAGNSISITPDVANLKPAPIVVKSKTLKVGP